MARRSGAVLGIAFALVLGSVVVSRREAPSVAALGGCLGTACDGKKDIIIGPEQGIMIDENTWTTAFADGEWLDYQGQQRYYFQPPFGGRLPYEWSVYVSVSAHPYADHNLIAEATGNLAQVGDVGPNQIAVSNGTCSHYYMRVVLRAPPFPPPPYDAGTDGGDAAAPDAEARDAEASDAEAPDASD